mgnify:CR=1 FL=1
MLLVVRGHKNKIDPSYRCVSENDNANSYGILEMTDGGNVKRKLSLPYSERKSVENLMNAYRSVFVDMRSEQIPLTIPEHCQDGSELLSLIRRQKSEIEKQELSNLALVTKNNIIHGESNFRGTADSNNQKCFYQNVDKGSFIQYRSGLQSPSGLCSDVSVCVPKTEESSIYLEELYRSIESVKPLIKVGQNISFIEEILQKNIPSNVQVVSPIFSHIGFERIDPIKSNTIEQHDVLNMNVTFRNSNGIDATMYGGTFYFPDNYRMVPGDSKDRSPTLEPPPQTRSYNARKVLNIIENRNYEVTLAECMGKTVNEISKLKSASVEELNDIVALYSDSDLKIIDALLKHKDNNSNGINFDTVLLDIIDTIISESDDSDGRQNKLHRNVAESVPSLVSFLKSEGVISTDGSMVIDTPSEKENNLLNAAIQKELNQFPGDRYKNPSNERTMSSYYERVKFLFTLVNIRKSWEMMSGAHLEAKKMMLNMTRIESLASASPPTNTINPKTPVTKRMQNSPSVMSTKHSERSNTAMKKLLSMGQSSNITTRKYNTEVEYKEKIPMSKSIEEMRDEKQNLERALKHLKTLVQEGTIESYSKLGKIGNHWVEIKKIKQSWETLLSKFSNTSGFESIAARNKLRDFTAYARGEIGPLEKVIKSLGDRKNAVNEFRKNVESLSETSRVFSDMIIETLDGEEEGEEY